MIMQVQLQLRASTVIQQGCHGMIGAKYAHAPGCTYKAFVQAVISLNWHVHMYAAAFASFRVHENQMRHHNNSQIWAHA